MSYLLATSSSLWYDVSVKSPDTCSYLTCMLFFCITVAKQKQRVFLRSVFFAETSILQDTTVTAFLDANMTRFRGCQVHPPDLAISDRQPEPGCDIQRPGEIPDTFGSMSFLEVLVPWIYKGNSKRYWNLQVCLVHFGSSISFCSIYI